MTLKAVALNVTLKSNQDEPSSAQRMLGLISVAMTEEGQGGGLE